MCAYVTRRERGSQLIKDNKDFDYMCICILTIYQLLKFAVQRAKNLTKKLLENSQNPSDRACPKNVYFIVYRPDAIVLGIILQ